MRRDLLVIVLMAGPSCGDSGDQTNARLDGLLQRLDAMDRRLDELEDAAQAAAPATEPPIEATRDAFVLPPRLAEGAEGLRSTVSVTVRAHELLIDGEVVGLADAAERLRESARANPGARLVLLAESDVPHARVVEVIDMARSAGLYDVEMSARIHGEAEEPAP